MKITKQELANIIKEEVEKALSDKGVNEVDAVDRFDGLRPRTGSPQTKDPAARLSSLSKVWVSGSLDLTDNLLEQLEFFDARPVEGGFVITEQQYKNALVIAEDLKDFLEEIGKIVAKIERSLRPRDL